ncbi:STM4015 family protein [Streptomyces sp. DSM 44915]|uniref:STM4015 family protein n=1 Tax=Streptomyces chisholmiae TaxID=3075540 RepID=A0ABU2JJJ8_9ACTN|nr:STM4015 family protein [Streptomyces sp. DSM 44915]MDT0265165.1 STM4015 family protein [Streptomyces sp. DSM 44915]
MPIHEHLRDFHELPVFEFPDLLHEPDGAGELPAPETVAWRVRIDTDDEEQPWADAFARFLDTVDTTAVRALVVGAWNEVYDTSAKDVIDALVAARDRLPALRALFLGDIVGEEAEISWIVQGAVAPLLEAFPELAEFAVRGAQELSFGPLRHERLRRLTIESGGLPAEVVRQVAASELPALTHLDLWLGTPEYGGDAGVTDLAPILAGARLPSLQHLGLRNSQIQDEVCAALASAPVVARLAALDVSMGVLTDEGAAALLAGQPLTHLDALDMRHHYLSDGMCARLREALEPAGVRLDLDRGRADSHHEPDGSVWRWVAVGE